MLLLRDNPLVRIRANAFAGLNTIQFLYLPSWIKVSIMRTKGPEFFVFGDLFCRVFFFRPCYCQFIRVLQRILRNTLKTVRFSLWLAKDENCTFQISYFNRLPRIFRWIPRTKISCCANNPAICSTGYLLFRLATVFYMIPFMIIYNKF